MCFFVRKELFLSRVFSEHSPLEVFSLDTKEKTAKTVDFSGFSHQ